MSARKLSIGPQAEGQRLDNFLMKQLKGVPRSRIYQMVRKGEVRVNGGRARVHTRLQAGDEVRIPPVQTRQAPATRIPGETIAQLKQAILHEDRDFLVLNKPAGMAVHKGSGQDWGVIEALRQASPEWKDLDLGHRLDRGTSGCLVLAKHRHALVLFQEELKQGQVNKFYLALVKGYPADQRMQVDLPLSRQLLQGGERMVRVDEREGKPASTIFRTQERYRQASLVQCELLTGRTHQIRVHAAAMGFPLAGDEKYGDRAFNQHMRNLGLKRLFLHSSMVEFTALNNERLMISAPLPDALNEVLNRL